MEEIAFIIAKCFSPVCSPSLSVLIDVSRIGVPPVLRPKHQLRSAATIAILWLAQRADSDFLPLVQIEDFRICGETGCL